MSRIGKQKLLIADKVTVKRDGSKVVVKGPLGQNERDFPAALDLAVTGNQASLSLVRPSVEQNAIWGTYATHLKNMILGVTTGFQSV